MNISASTYEPMLKIGKELALTWQENSTNQQLIKNVIITYGTLKSILCMLYGIFTANNDIRKLEELPVEVIYDLELEAKEWTPDAEGKQLTVMMKSIWTMNYLLCLHDTDE